ncbi:MAG: DUF1707 domain-containing protein [Rhodococcus sp.]|nr:DUF1707 domain-containing protein [Rhodococcus sp. (in: high G+C Gram-positive bacteria)]
MASRYPLTTRARSADREATCAQLDTAFGDGQLDEKEYTARVELAHSSQTLGDLAVLTEDLQATGAPLPRPPRRLPVFAPLLAAAAIAAVIGGYLAVRTGDDDAPPATAESSETDGASGFAPIDAAGIESIVIANPTPTSAEGMATIFERYREKFGDSLVDSMSLYSGGHASVTRSLPAQPNREVRYDYRGGFTQSQTPSSRSVDTPTIDLASINIDAVGGHLATAPALLNIPDGAVNHMSIETSHRGGPVIRVFVSNDFSENAHLELGLDGALLQARPFGGN